MNAYIILTSVVFITLFGTCVCHCPNGWVYFEGSCYLFGHDGKPFTEAEHFCLQHHAHLVKIDSANEDMFLKAYSAQLKNANWWIGLTDADIEGFWKWTDETTASYINWYPGQPNQQSSANCACLYYTYNYGWVDEPCYHTYLPICENRESGETAIIG